MACEASKIDQTAKCVKHVLNFQLESVQRPASEHTICMPLTHAYTVTRAHLNS